MDRGRKTWDLTGIIFMLGIIPQRHLEGRRQWGEGRDWTLGGRGSKTKANASTGITYLRTGQEKNRSYGNTRGKGKQKRKEREN